MLSVKQSFQRAGTINHMFKFILGGSHTNVKNVIFSFQIAIKLNAFDQACKIKFIQFSFFLHPRLVSWNLPLLMYVHSATNIDPATP